MRKLESQCNGLIHVEATCECTREAVTRKLRASEANQERLLKLYDLQTKQVHVLEGELAKALNAIQVREKDEQATQGTAGLNGSPEGLGRPDSGDSVLGRGPGAAVEVTSKDLQQTQSISVLQAALTNAIEAMEMGAFHHDACAWLRGGECACAREKVTSFLASWKTGGNAAPRVAVNQEGSNRTCLSTTQTAEQAAEAFVQQHGRMGGSSLATIETFKAGAAWQLAKDLKLAADLHEKARLELASAPTDKLPTAMASEVSASGSVGAGVPPGHTGGSSSQLSARERTDIIAAVCDISPQIQGLMTWHFEEHAKRAAEEEKFRGDRWKESAEKARAERDVAEEAPAAVNAVEAGKWFDDWFANRYGISYLAAEIRRMTFHHVDILEAFHAGRDKTLAVARPVEQKTQFVWLIEMGSPAFYKGRDSLETGDASKAIWFADKESAERVIKLMGWAEQWKAVEHGFM